MTNPLHDAITALYNRPDAEREARRRRSLAAQFRPVPYLERSLRLSKDDPAAFTKLVGTSRHGLEVALYEQHRAAAIEEGLFEPGKEDQP